MLHVFALVINLTIVGSMMALAVLMLQAFLKGRVKRSVFVLLWLIVFIRFCVPFSIQSELSVLNVVPLKTASESSFFITSSPNYVGEIRSMGTSFFQMEGQTFHLDQDVKNPDLEIATENTSANKKSKWDFFLHLVSIIWICGSVTFAGLIVVAYMRVVMGGRGSQLMQCEIATRIQALLKLKRLVPIYLTSQKEAPFIVGILFPRVMLPKAITSSQLNHILLHEMIHVKRLDNFKKIFSIIVLCIHWFNPLVWICFFQFQKDIETSCDEAVIDITGDNEKKAYATSLFEFASQGGGMNMKTFVSFGENGAKSRIRNILQYKGTSKPMLIIAVVLTISLCAGFMTNPLASVIMKENQRMVYAVNDGLYSIDLQQGESVKIVDGKGIGKPVFSQDGTAVAFVQNGDLYGYDFQRQETTLLMKEVLSYCPGMGDQFYISSKLNGIVRMGLDEKVEVIYQPVHKKGGFTICEAVQCSPDGTLLAFSQESYFDPVESDPAKPKYEGNGGVWIYDLTSKTEKPPKQIQNGNSFQEYINNDYTPLLSQPHPGKWSADSKQLFIWQDVMSASTRADGIGGSIYDVKEDKLIMLGQGAAGSNEAWTYDGNLLAYEENVRFDGKGNMVILNGGGREMGMDKTLQRISYDGKLKKEIIKTPGLAPAMPNVTNDGECIYFAASKETEMPTTQDQWDHMYPLQRQIYAFNNGEIKKLTNDQRYRYEAPILTGDEKSLIMGRIDKDGNMSIYMMDVDGSHLRELVQLKGKANPESDHPYPDNYDDFYGRGGWHEMFAIYGGQR